MMMHKRFISALIFSALALAPLSAFGQTAKSVDTTFSDQAMGISVLLPKNWMQVSYKYDGARGGQVYLLYVAQQVDLQSRAAKYFFVETGTPASIFNLNQKVINSISKDQLIDFYIDSLSNSAVNFTVTSYSTAGTGDNKVYMFETKNTIPGPYTVIQIHRFQFKNDRVYHTLIRYLTSHESYRSILESIQSSMTIL